MSSTPGKDSLCVYAYAWIKPDDINLELFRTSSQKLFLNSIFVKPILNSSTWEGAGDLKGEFSWNVTVSCFFSFFQMSFIMNASLCFLFLFFVICFLIICSSNMGGILFN